MHDKLPMKTILKVILICFTLWSCSDDDTSATDELLVGTWIGESSTWNGNDTGTPDSNIIIFMANHRTEFIYEGFGTNGQDISEMGSWTKSGNTLTITWDEADAGLGTYVLQIEELTASRLKWITDIQGEGTLRESYQR